MDFYYLAGKVALGSRLRRLSERLTEDAAKVYALYGIPLDPKWFPVFYVLSAQEAASITEIAQIIGHSHPSVSRMVKEMKHKGLIVSGKSAEDARMNIVMLSDTGRQLIPAIEIQCHDVAQVVDDLLLSAQHNIWQAIEEFEYLLDSKSFLDRIQATRKDRECQNVEIIEYSSEFQDDFRRLNYEWIERYFAIEEADCQSLNQPNKKIIEPGGKIYMARQKDEVVGTCALIKINDDVYELAKMAVAEKVRGQGIGWLLGKAAIAAARELGAKTVCLESNTVLEPAIKLYQKLGFQKVVGKPSPYQRCNIQMELKLEQSCW